MLFHYNINSFRTTIIFIHGFMKTHTDFNTTFVGKPIMIESTLRKNHNTIMIQIESDDYLKSIRDIAEIIHKELMNNPSINTTKFVMVAHSYGALYLYHLAETYPATYHKLFLIDPTVKTKCFLSKLLTKISIKSFRSNIIIENKTI